MIVFFFGFLCFGLDSLSSESFSFLQANLNKTESLFAKPASNFLRESPNIALLGENSIVAVSPPSSIDTQVLGSIVGGGEMESDGGNNVFEYIVQEGDTISAIADKYGISTDTILWANELSSKSVISAGQKLVVLPVSGVLYYVKSGDTLSEIAEIFKGELDEIVEFNSLSNEGDMFVGDILIIPGGKMPAKPTATYTVPQTPIGNSSFICPHADCYITQGLHWYNAIDFGGKCGDPIYAAAAGTVQRVGYGWNGGAGNYVRIIHHFAGGDVITMYGHLQTILVKPDQPVSQGEIIALMGGKPGMAGAGISTGCHVHFDVRGSRNPFSK